MRVTGFWALAGLVVGGVMLADLVHNPKGTRVLTNAGVTSERTAVAGLLGKVK
jgi:hypothetical protein